MTVIITLFSILLYQAHYATSDKDICSDALGIQSGRIKDFQMSAVEAYKSDMSTFGPKNARLMKTSAPQGYRGNKNKPEKSWVSVDLGRQMVVTRIATQGYGNASIQEWITEFNLMYSVEGQDFTIFKDAEGQNAKFVGNKDFNTVHRQKVPFPVIATRITILPTKWNNNVGLRMEVYGCKPDFRFRAILMLSGRSFTMNYRNNQSYEYTLGMEESTLEAITYWNSVPGFLGLLFKGFSPQKSPSFFTLAAVQFEVYCLESTLADLLAKMKDFIRESDIFDSTFYKIQYPRTNICSTPILNIQPLANDDSRSIAIIKGSIPTFTIDLKHDCKLQTTLIIQWNTAFIDDATGQMSPLSPRDLNTRKITLDPSSFHTSIIYLECFAYTLGMEGNFARDYRFIRNIEARLVARIEGFRHAIKGGNNITIDGIKSSAQGDPEFLNDINLDFSWFCQMRQSNYTDIEDSLRKASSSCFGKAINEIISKERVLNIDNNDLIGGMEYDFKLVVNANGVAATANHTMTVEPFINISIRCFSNCLRKINPTEKQLLGCECTGPACEKLIKYEWSFFLFDKKTKKYRERKLSGNATSISKSQKRFQIKSFENLIGFKNNKEEKFEIRLAVYIDNLAFIHTNKYFILNAVPSSNSEHGCYVVPRVGYAMNTYYNMSCANWKDDDLPLTYKFQYISEFGMIILQSGYSPRISTQLLPGNNASNFTYDVIITVTDSLGAPQLTRFPVQVLLPSASEAKTMIKNIDGELDGLLGSGNSEKAADMSLYTISLLNTFDRNPQTEIKTKNSILRHLSKAKTSSLAQVSKFGVVAKTATSQSEKLEHKTQKDAMNLMENACTTMTTIVANKSSDVNLGLIESIAENFVTGVSNVLNSSLEDVNSSVILSPNDKTKIEFENTIEKKRKISKKSDTVIKGVAATITSLMNVGDAPRIVRSNNVAVRVERNTPASFDRKEIGQGRSKIILPPSRDILSNTNSTPLVMDCQIIEYPVNPFFWHRSSRAVKSSVIDVSIHTDTDQKMRLSLLENPINLFLPRKNPDNNQFTERNYSAVEMNYFLKPGNISNTTEYIRYHKILIPSPYVSVTMILIPQKGEYIEVFISAKKRPTPYQHFYKKILPDLSSCNDTNVKTFDVRNCTSDPYKLEMSSNATGAIGMHYIGLRHIPPKPDKKVLKLNDSILNEIKITFLKLFKRERKEVNKDTTFAANPCKSHSGRQKRSCVGIKDPPTTPPNIVTLYPTFNPVTDIKYHLDSFLSSCLFWSEVEEKWKSDGCKLGAKSSYSQVHCLCHHLTAFGGDVVIAPNPIEFDKVLIEFSRLEESKNFVVLSTVLLMWTVFAVGLVMARRADNFDKQKIVNCGIETPSKENNAKTYKISIHTGVWLGSGTTANVGMILYSVDDYSEPIYFNNIHSDKRLFARGSINTFYVNHSSDIKDLFKIRIWHDNFGEDPSWFIKDVVVSDEDEEERWYFLVDRWLAVNKADHNISAEFLLTEEKEAKKFKNRFYSRAAKQFTNTHLWLSVFMRNIHSPFTRCQRLACCFLVLMATMVTNAMFYQFGPSSSDIFLVGPFHVSVRAIKTSIQSCLIVLPVSVLVVLIFENVKQNQINDDEEEKSIIVERKVKGFIPKRFVAFAWFLCISGAAVSSAFTVFYSLMWGTEIANQWLASIMMSFIQDVLFIQPIKIIVLVSILATITKKPVDHHKEVNIPEKRDVVSCHKVEIPPTEDLAIARDFATKKTAMKRVIMEYILYLLFILLLFIVCYGNRDTNRFMVTDSIRSMVPNYEKVKDDNLFWKWIENEAILKLFEVQWYNGQPFSEPEGLIKNKKTFLVGMPRLRQLRTVPDDECLRAILPVLASQFQRCIPQYSMFTEENSPYNLPKWKALTNFTSYLSKFEIEKLCPIPWRYRDFHEIETLPFFGTTAAYGGGGFVADLGYKITTAKDVVKKLQENDWIDEYTSAIVLEFTLYNPATSLFSSVKFLFERFSTGSLNALNRIDTITVYSPTNKSLLSFLQICQFLLMVIVIALMISEFIKIYHTGRSYFKGVWNLVQWLQIVSIICAIVMFYFKEKYTNRFIAHLRVNPFETSSADYIVLWSDLETIILSFVIFIITIKLLRLIRYNPLVCHLNSTLRRSFKFICSFSVLFVIVMLGLAFMATLAFGRFSYDFSSFPKTLSKLLQLLVGGKIYQKDINFSQSPLGPLFVLFYTVFTSVILVNVLVSILIESFTTSRKHIDPQHLHDLEFGLFMKNNLHKKVASGQEKMNKMLRKTCRSSHKGEVYVKCSTDKYDGLRKINKKKINIYNHCSKDILSKDVPFDCLSHGSEACDEDVLLKEIKGSLAEICSILKSSISDVEMSQ